VWWWGRCCREARPLQGDAIGTGGMDIGSPRQLNDGEEVGGGEELDGGADTWPPTVKVLA
jgi:hypothetical protein